MTQQRLFGSSANAITTFEAADYDRAERLLEPNLAKLFYHTRIRHRWSEGGRSLTYSTNARGGERHVRIDVATGEHTRLATDPFVETAETSPGELPSPDGTLALVCRDHDLWLRDRGADRLRRLTHDGEPFFAYGKPIDDSTRTIVRRRTLVPFPPADCAWSPDGRFVFGQRNDERAVLSYPYVEAVPLDGSHRPKLHALRVALLGEPGRVVQDPFVLRIESGHRTSVIVPKGWALDPTPLAWTADCAKLFALATTSDHHGRGLFEITTASGEAREIITERSTVTSYAYFFNAFEYTRPNVRVIDQGRRVIWYGQQEGFGRLYLHDVSTGALVRALTPEGRIVLDLIAVDEPRRRVLVTIAGDERGADPYRRDLFSVSLDDGAPIRLTSDDMDHAIAAPLAPLWAGMLETRAGSSAVSPDGGVFLDAASTLDRPTIITLRLSIDGAQIVELERADAADAVAAGWRPPIRFSAKAADGATDLWGALYLPPDFDPSASYPVIDALYGGPQLVIAPRAFAEGGPAGAIIGRHSLAALGFVVFSVDGRGTPGRNRAFWEAGYGNFADVGIDDHLAVLQQLAARYPAIDLAKVGVFGHSFGGYVAARAMLRYPEIYKVGVSSAAVHNWQGFRAAYEQYQGLAVYEGGTRDRSTPDGVPDHYRSLDNGTLAHRLAGKLLLAYADLDENALPSSTLQFIDALTKANKRYDLLYFPNGDHAFNLQPYFIQRLFDYFAEHLLGARPPTDYALNLDALVR